MENFQIVIIPLLVAVITQTTKFIIFSFKKGKIEWNYFFTHGHMPSSHSAIAVAIVTTLGFTEGVNTGVFALATVFALIILDDAFRIRMYLGDQGRYLNMLVETLELSKDKYPRLKEHVGHRSSEVVVGLIYGFLLTLLFLWIFGII